MEGTPNQEIIFSGSTLFGFGLSGMNYLLLPAAAFLLMRKYRAARIYPVIIGIIVYFLAVKCSDLCANIIGASQSLAVKSLIAVELVCWLEESGRWLAMRYPVADIRDVRSAVCLGIGHGGLECWIRCVQKFRILHYGQQINSSGIGSFLSGKAPERTAEITAALQEYANHSLALSILDSLESIAAFGFHIALSVFLFKKMQESNFAKRWLLAAVGLHYVMNGIPWLASLTGSLYVQDIAGILTAIGIIAFVSKTIDGKACMDEIRYPELAEVRSQEVEVRR